ncbi:uncharacterized protein LOC113347921 isoform X1 [Papaver somniferum]|uniref:uncharacterized protein LOC113347921 isoform X1 n=1 Tax=Papaver somniferum TaxID=3469 RepID=UPI000E6F7B07|nr:uncharacterized protein LOC113347921 isoform X1 [Papaver somniferum]XP_026447399.1 uncharacterized protein LOC113347921 isoform X1 [Papaver somniferum]
MLFLIRYGGGMSSAKSTPESDTVACSFLGLKKHLKRLNALKHWMLVNLGTTFRFLHSMMETQGVLIVVASLQIMLGFSQEKTLEHCGVTSDNRLHKQQKLNDKRTTMILVVCEPGTQHMDALLDIICEVLL